MTYERPPTSKKRLVRYTPGLNGTAFMWMLKENELADGFYGPEYDWTQGPYVLASDADTELDRQAEEVKAEFAAKLREIAEARASLLALTQEVPHG